MPVVIIVLIILLILFLFMIAPSKPDSTRTVPFLNRYFAHRGLYEPDQSIAENTLPAFERAIEAGYGIELDIRFSKDNQIVVFHDNTLARAAGIDQPVEHFTYEELAAIPLYGTDARIPLFRDVLDLIDGRVPLIVEIKAGKQNERLSAEAFEMLRHYKGPYCVESFDPRIIRWFKKNAPEVYRGQLACCYSKAAAENSKPVSFLASRCMLNFLSRPNFIAYELIPLPFSVRLSEKMGAVPVCWTSRSENDADGKRMVIFEHYRPPVSF